MPRPPPNLSIANQISKSTRQAIAPRLTARNFSAGKNDDPSTSAIAPEVPAQLQEKERLADHSSPLRIRKVTYEADLQAALETYLARKTRRSNGRIPGVGDGASGKGEEGRSKITKYEAPLSGVRRSMSLSRKSIEPGRDLSAPRYTIRKHFALREGTTYWNPDNPKERIDALQKKELPPKIPTAKLQAERKPSRLPLEAPSLYVSLLIEDEGEEGNAVRMARKAWDFVGKGREVPRWKEQKMFRHLPYPDHEKYTEALAEFAGAQGPFEMKVHPIIHTTENTRTIKNTHIRFEMAGSILERLFATLSETLEGTHFLNDTEVMHPSTRPPAQWTVLAKARLKTREEAEQLVEKWKADHAKTGGTSNILVKGLSIGLEKSNDLYPITAERAMAENHDLSLWPESKVYMFTGETVDERTL
ncbi:hypothetical protein VTL71DRAFT_2990 [Oculimacula yallundae]|uniref:Uncharacterized protein n=1 Tax=Oculimacula yallundae TaxID=86028 RepID=A0ABR4C5W2_9HELO